MVSCQINLSSGFIPGNLEIGYDEEDENLEQPEPEQAQAVNKLVRV